MDLRVTRHNCHACGGHPITITTGRVADIERRQKLIAPHLVVKPDFDAGGRYWCGGCWHGSDGKHQRRRDKLLALAEDPRTPIHEKENALRRIAEMGGESTLRERLMEDVAKFAESVRRAEERRIVRRRQRRVMKRAMIVNACVLPLSFLSKLPMTGLFYSMTMVFVSLVCAWFVFRPDEKRWTFVQSIALAVWLAFLGWMWLPFEQVFVSGFVKLS